MNRTAPIDVVYTWVDGGDADYRALTRRYARKKTDLNPERYRDEYSLLKYSLRSLERYVPWYRNVYIVTCRPQVPKWLNTAHPDIRVVHHDQIFDREYLPTFNSNAIESFLHRIPGLSDCFLYVNDDHLFGRETLKSDFITRAGRIRIPGTLLGEHPGFRVYQDKFELVSLGFIEHTPLLIPKAAWQAMLAQRPGAVHRTRQNRFRTGDELQMDKFYRWFMLARMKHCAAAIPFYKLIRYHRFHKITNDLKHQVKALDRIRRKQPKFYCLNDDQQKNPNRAVVQRVKDFLEAYYPKPSAFEK